MFRNLIFNSFLLNSNIFLVIFYLYFIIFLKCLIFFCGQGGEEVAFVYLSRICAVAGK